VTPFSSRRLDSRPSQWDRRMYTSNSTMALGFTAAVLLIIGYAMHQGFAYTMGIVMFALSGAVEVWMRRGSVALRAVLVMVILGSTAFLLTHPWDAWYWMEDIVKTIGKYQPRAGRR